MTPDEYRAKWGLHSDHPLVAPNYANARAGLAKRFGLGQRKTANEDVTQMVAEEDNSRSGGTRQLSRGEG